MTYDNPPVWAKDLMGQILKLREDVQRTASIETIEELRVALVARMDRLQEAVEARYEDKS